jgi:hypothetical protein
VRLAANSASCFVMSMTLQPFPAPGIDFDFDMQNSVPLRQNSLSRQEFSFLVA